MLFRTFSHWPVRRYGHIHILAVFLLAGTLSAVVARAQSAAEDDPSLTPLPPPSLSFYGAPGLIDMPSAEMLPDGQFTASISNFGGQTKYNLTFQATPWLSGTFRYNSIQDWNLDGFDTYYDRSFDLRLRLFKEGQYRPEITLGLQDFAGTGIYAGEYIVATKRFEVPGWGGRYGEPGQVKLTAGDRLGPARLLRGYWHVGGSSGL